MDRRLATQVANIVARGTVQLVNDAKMMQLVQVGALADETVEGAEGIEHFESYGFSSVPFAGAEHVTLFIDGDRSNPITVMVADRRHRPTGGVAGEVCIYTDEGDVIRLGRGHIISLATSGEVRIGSASASQGAVKGTQRNTAEQTFLTAMSTFVAAITDIVAVPTAAKAAFTAAISAFASAAAGAVSTKVKLE